ncbi:MAG TPA: PDZ domain-containing protein [Acidimicrobiales bacterium]|nr:PDZ domain-containing protein [Acidimicrobiales bacterium]
MTSSAYLRFPALHNDLVVFVTEDDLWAVSADGGPARRLTADHLEVGRPALSPDGSLVAFTSTAEGQTDVYVMGARGGPPRRLTWLGEAAVRGWTPDGRIVMTSAAGQPFAVLAQPYALSPTPAPGAGPTPLPYGPVTAVSYGPAGGVVVGRNTADPARWKRYRGGTAGDIWIDRGGTGDWHPLLERPSLDGAPSSGPAFPGNLACPMWIGERIWFLSDHEGVGNLYSCAPDGTGLARHTDHEEHYARWAATDGARIVYQVAAAVWLYDPATGETRRLEVEVASPRTQRRPHFVDADRHLGGFALDRQGGSLVLDVRGKLVSFPPWEGPVTQHGQAQGVRYRLARFAGEAAIVAVSDDGGEEGLEVHDPHGDGGPVVRRLPVPDLGRVVEVAPSPAGDTLAVTNHRNQLLVVAVADGATRVIDESGAGRPGDPAWSPDGRWLAYSFPASEHTRQIKVAEVASGQVHQVTAPAFQDAAPVFDPRGRYLGFLSRRSFDPVYDALAFDLGFPRATRAYLVTLRAADPSPLLVRPAAGEDGQEREGGTPPTAPEGGDGQGPEAVPTPRVDIDLEGIGERVVALPFPAGRYEALVLLETKALVLSRPIEGALSRDIFATGPPANGTIESYDLAEDKHEILVEEVAEVVFSGDRSHLAYATTDEEGGRQLRLLRAGAKPPEDTEHAPPGRAGGWIDLARPRLLVDPGAEWAQMLTEAWRLQREDFWVADMSGVDWEAVLARYVPLVGQVATRAELSDLIWEMQGELGTSHAYELGGDYRQPPEWTQARLGADLTWDPATSRWRVARVARGASWDPREASPLAAPGVAVAPGAAIVAINGQPVPAETGPGPLLANQAGQPVEMTVEGPGGTGTRRVLVPTLADERPLRYRDWVAATADRVHQATDGRVGYVHVPDMMARGFAEFHRSYLAEVERDALIVDVRFNAGGHVSGLLLEKLARRRIGYDVPRRGTISPYPAESVAGPLVLVTNEWAGSDGDIFTHGFQVLGLGPVVGTRTWGGVIGIEPTHPLVDGSLTTQPEYAYWFVDVGWGVENHGADPDHEVQVRPQDYAEGRDPQLETALALILDALAGHQPRRPDLTTRPRLDLPRLPARG